MMSKSWPLVPLRDVLTQISRAERVEPTKEYHLLGVRLEGEGPFLREIKLGSQTSATQLFKVQKGDFIYSRLFAWRGAFGVIGTELDGCYVSNEFPTFLPVQEKIDVEFLRYWFRLPKAITAVEADCAGSTPLTRNRFKEQFFLSLKIPLPLLAEQRRIVVRIEELAAKIEEARKLRQLAVLEAEAFVTSLHAKLSGSRIKKLSEIILLEEDAVPIKPTDSYPQVGVRGFGGGLFAKSATSGMDTTYRAFNRLYEGALVMSQVKAWEGAVAVCGKELAGMFVSPEYRTFRFNENEAEAEYFAAIVKTEWFWSKLKDATRGVGARRERTRPEQFLNIEIPVPLITEQHNASKIFHKIASLKRIQSDTVAELDAMLPSILDKAFRGELV